MNDVLEVFHALESSHALPRREDDVASLLERESSGVREGVTYLGFMSGAVAMDGSPTFSLAELRESLRVLPQASEAEEFTSILRAQLPVVLASETLTAIYEYARTFRDGARVTGKVLQFSCNYCDVSVCRCQLLVHLSRATFECPVCKGDQLCLWYGDADADSVEEAPAPLFGALKWLILERMQQPT